MGTNDLDPGEQELGSWTVNYLPADGGRYVGDLVVTDQNLRFRARFDTSDMARKVLGTAAAGAVSGVAGAAVGKALFDGDDGQLVVPRESIAGADAAKKGLTKQVVVQLLNGNALTFDYGMLSVKKIVAAVQQA